MESLIFHDSPLAEYLEGTAVAEGDPNSTTPSEPLSPTSDTVSFAPRGLPVGYSKARRKRLDSLILDGRPRGSTIVGLQLRCTKMLSSHIGPDSSKFLDRFRYIIVASQLLSDRGNTFGFNPRPISQSATPARKEAADWKKPSHTLLGISATVGAAFALAWFINWTRSLAQETPSWWRIGLALVILTAAIGAAYAFYRWQTTSYVQTHATEVISSFVVNAQDLDAAMSAAISLIQEVELVSRGYRISTPLSPVSRLEDQGQTRRCERLRGAIRGSLSALIVPYAKAYISLKDFAVEVDLERYNDIYEVTRMDVEDVETLANGGAEEFGDPETLRALKVGLQRLLTVRKLFLCCLLAIPSSGQRSDLSVWSLITTTIDELSTASSAAAISLDSIFTEESRFSIPRTPIKSPLAPGREHLRGQIRKFASLNQGTRELQAQMYLLREESDRALEAPSADTDTNGAELGAKLLEQYDAFGADLKALVRDWEDGRVTLVAALDRQHERRVSLTSSSAGLLLSRSTTPSSLGGLTAVGGSPSDALKILNGDSLMGSIEPTSSDEEVFEAIALPRPKSMVTREERIAKMKEERLRTAERKEKSDARGNMVKELETVIRFRPRAKGARVTSL